MIAPPDPVPNPVPLREEEALAVLRMVARLYDATVVRLYGGGSRSPPMRLRNSLGLAAVGLTAPLPWNNVPTWVFDGAALRWCAPNMLRGGYAFVTWRGVDDPGAPP